jgi:hypothetical protein
MNNQRVILDGALERSVIRGTLTAATGERREFQGWLELDRGHILTLDAFRHQLSDDTNTNSRTQPGETGLAVDQDRHSVQSQTARVPRCSRDSRRSGGRPSPSTTASSAGGLPWGSVPGKDDPGQWALIRVSDGATLARFDDELTARSAMAGLDDDEVVLLAVDATQGRLAAATSPRAPDSTSDNETTREVQLRHELALAYTDFGAAAFALAHHGALRDPRLTPRFQRIYELTAQLGAIALRTTARECVDELAGTSTRFLRKPDEYRRGVQPHRAITAPGDANERGRLPARLFRGKDAKAPLRAIGRRPLRLASIERSRVRPEEGQS